MVGKGLELNLRFKPEDTFLYDSLPGNQSDALLDQIKLYNELTENLKLNAFMADLYLSRHFVIVSTFHDENVAQDREFVAEIEGVTFPFFGLAYSVDKVQFNYDLSIHDRIDHSRKAIENAQRISNFFVDEARLSSNFFGDAKTEVKSLISNFDITVVEEDGRLLEVYLF